MYITKFLEIASFYSGFLLRCVVCNSKKVVRFGSIETLRLICDYCILCHYCKLCLKKKEKILLMSQKREGENSVVSEIQFPVPICTYSDTKTEKKSLRKIKFDSGNLAFSFKTLSILGKMLIVFCLM